MVKYFLNKKSVLYAALMCLAAVLLGAANTSFALSEHSIPKPDYIQTFQQYVNKINTLSYSDYAKYGVDENTFNSLKNYLETTYQGVTSDKSFYDSQLRSWVDCIPIAEQPALKGEKLSPAFLTRIKKIIAKQDGHVVTSKNLVNIHVLSVKNRCKVGDIPLPRLSMLSLIEFSQQVPMPEKPAPTQKDPGASLLGAAENTSSDPSYYYNWAKYSTESQFMRHHLVAGIGARFNIWPLHYNVPIPIKKSWNLSQEKGHNEEQVWLDDYSTGLTTPLKVAHPILQSIEGGEGVYPWLNLLNQAHSINYKEDNSAQHIWFYSTRLAYHRNYPLPTVCYNLGLNSESSTGYSCKAFVQIANNVIVGYQGIYIPRTYNHKSNMSSTDDPMRDVGLKCFAWMIPPSQQVNGYKYRWAMHLTAANFSGLVGYYRPGWWDDDGRWDNDNVTGHKTFADTYSVWPEVGAEICAPVNAQRHPIATKMGSGLWASSTGSNHSRVAYIGDLVTYPHAVSYKMARPDKSDVCPLKIKPGQQGALNSKTVYTSISAGLSKACYSAFAPSASDQKKHPHLGAYFYFGGPGYNPITGGCQQSVFPINGNL